MKITNESQIKTGDAVFDTESKQVCKIKSILKKGVVGSLGVGSVNETVVTIEEGKNLKNYTLSVTCEKCGAGTSLTYMQSGNDKFRCYGILHLDDKDVICSSKKFIEGKKKYLGIDVVRPYLLTDFCRKFETHEKV